MFETILQSIDLKRVKDDTFVSNLEFNKVYDMVKDTIYPNDPPATIANVSISNTIESLISYIYTLKLVYKLKGKYNEKVFKIKIPNNKTNFTIVTSSVKALNNEIVYGKMIEV